MKTLFAAALTAATILATPALAASRHHHASQARAAASDYGQEMGYEMNTLPPDIVVSANHVLGQDPDSNIRIQLIHEGEVSTN